MPTARKRATPKVPEPLRHDVTAPEPVQAAQIALLVMKKTKCQTWKGVIEKSQEMDIREKVWLQPEQQDLIDRYAALLPFLSTSPLVTVVACPVCGSFGLHDKRPPGTKCIFTIRCEGKPVKASSVEVRRAPAATDSEGPVDVEQDLPPQPTAATPQPETLDWSEPVPPLDPYAYPPDDGGGAAHFPAVILPSDYDDDGVFG